MREGECFRNTGCWGLWYDGYLLAYCIWGSSEKKKKKGPRDSCSPKEKKSDMEFQVYSKTVNGSQHCQYTAVCHSPPAWSHARLLVTSQHSPTELGVTHWRICGHGRPSHILLAQRGTLTDPVSRNTLLSMSGYWQHLSTLTHPTQPPTWSRRDTNCSLTVEKSFILSRSQTSSCPGIILVLWTTGAACE